jgi:hypothetical protein
MPPQSAWRKGRKTRASGWHNENRELRNLRGAFKTLANAPFIGYHRHKIAEQLEKSLNESHPLMPKDEKGQATVQKLFGFLKFEMQNALNETVANAIRHGDSRRPVTTAYYVSPTEVILVSHNYAKPSKPVSEKSVLETVKRKSKEGGAMGSEEGGIGLLMSQTMANPSKSYLHITEDGKEVIAIRRWNLKKLVENALKKQAPLKG